MRKNCVIGVLAIAVAVSLAAEAGTLRIGQPVLHGDQVVVPVVLEGHVADGVAALSFQLNYDPGVVEPVDAMPGAAAQTAGKDVMTNVKDPGTYMVVMAGLNSNTMRSGEVTQIVLQRRGDDNSTNISITGTTLASLQGDEIPSRGSTGNISFREDTSDEREETGDEAGEEPPDAGDAEDQPDRPVDPIDGPLSPGTVPVDSSDGPVSRRTQDAAASASPSSFTESGQTGRPTGSSDGASPTTSADADVGRQLADALTAAAQSRSGISGRPSEASVSSGEGEAERSLASRRLSASEIQMAAIAETDHSEAEGAWQGGESLPGDRAPETVADETLPSAALAEDMPSGAARSPVTPGTSPDAADAQIPSTDRSTLAFLVIVVAVVIGIVVLRRRLFA